MTCSAPCPTTTTTLAGSRGSTARSTQSIRLRPATVCATLGRVDFIRLPSPAASTMTCVGKRFTSRRIDAGGAGLEPALTGPKPAVLPVTPPPNGDVRLPAGRPIHARRLSGPRMRTYAHVLRSADLAFRMSPVIFSLGSDQVLRLDQCPRRARPRGFRRRSPRLPWPQRSRQDHHHQDPPRPDSGRRGPGQPLRTRPLERGNRPPSPARLRAGRRQPLAQPHRGRGHRSPGTDERGARHRQAERAAGAGSTSTHARRGAPTRRETGKRSPWWPRSPPTSSC